MCGTIFVVNKYKHTPTDNDIYIGRGSPLGNPFSHLKSKFDDVITVGSREEAIKLYSTYLGIKILYEQDHIIIKAINEIITKVSKGDVNLVCFCSPKLCHGIVIAKLVKNLMYR